jgi:hypothetical protein
MLSVGATWLAMINCADAFLLIVRLDEPKGGVYRAKRHEWLHCIYIAPTGVAEIMMAVQRKGRGSGGASDGQRPRLRRLYYSKTTSHARVNIIVDRAHSHAAASTTLFIITLCLA